MKRRLSLMNVKNETVISGIEMNDIWAAIAGGVCTNLGCACACIYENQPGGTSTTANYSANEATHSHSPGYDFVHPHPTTVPID